MNAPLLAIAPARPAVPEPPPEAMSARTLLLLNGPIVPTLLRLAWPNVLVMLAQASTGLIETFWGSVSARTRSPEWRWSSRAS